MEYNLRPGCPICNLAPERRGIVDRLCLERRQLWASKGVNAALVNVPRAAWPDPVPTSRHVSEHRRICMGDPPVVRADARRIVERYEPPEWAEDAAEKGDMQAFEDWRGDRRSKGAGLAIYDEAVRALASGTYIPLVHEEAMANKHGSTPRYAHNATRVAAMHMEVARGPEEVRRAQLTGRLDATYAQAANAARQTQDWSAVVKVLELIAKVDGFLGLPKTVVNVNQFQQVADNPHVHAVLSAIGRAIDVLPHAEARTLRAAIRRELASLKHAEGVQWTSQLLPES